jgi:HD superfamily phosphodiesterase
MGDSATQIFPRDLRSAREFLRECLWSEVQRVESKVTGRLMRLVIDHTERVCMWTEVLCRLSGITQPEYVLMAAILHDCAKLRHDSPSGLQLQELHIVAGKKLAMKFLREELGKDQKLAHDIALIIGCHDFGMHRHSKSDLPEKLPEKIVHDANLLDYLDLWGLRLMVEYHFARRPENTPWDPRTVLEIAGKHALNLKKELTLEAAKSIAETTIQVEGREIKKGIFWRLARGMNHLCSLNLKTIEDFRRAFGEYLRVEDPELELTLKKLMPQGMKARIFF